MCFFKKKPIADKTLDDRNLISTTEKTVDSLIVLARQSEEFKKRLQHVQEKIKYLTPSVGGMEYDKKIKNAIDDLRIVLVKAENGELPQKANNLLTQIEVLIADRNANV